MSITINGTTGITTPDVTSDGLTVDTTTLVVDETNNRVGIGTASPQQQLHISNADGAGQLRLEKGTSSSADDGIGSIQFRTGNTTAAANIIGRTDASSSANGALAFYTGTTSSAPERARITSGGYFKASNTGTYTSSTGPNHELQSNGDGSTVEIRNTNTSTTSGGILFVAADRNTTNTSFYFLSCYNYGGSAYKLRIADSGNVTNTNGSYGTISDAKLKQDIVDATPQWDDIKNLRFRKYRLKSDVELDPNSKPLLGLVAQEAELVCPGLIEEHRDTDSENNDLGTTTKSIKTSVLYMKAVKALQEAQTRIETLEAQNAAFEARLAALEGAAQ